jgi:Transposase IS116/IS110/IS902 family
MRAGSADGPLRDRPLVAVTILAELGDCTRFSSSRHAVRYSGLDITVHQSDQRRAPGHLSRQGPPALRWALLRPRSQRVGAAARTVTTTFRRPSGSGTTARACQSRASCSSAHTTRCASSAMRR